MDETTESFKQLETPVPAPAKVEAKPIDINLAEAPKLPTLKMEVEYRDGIFFALNHVSKEEIQRIGKASIIMRWNKDTKLRSPELDADKFNSAFGKAAVNSWRGMTLRKLAGIVPIDLAKYPKEDWDTSVNFSYANLTAMLKASSDLDTFINANVTDLRVFRPELEEELGN